MKPFWLRQAFYLAHHAVHIAHLQHNIPHHGPMLVIRAIDNVQLRTFNINFEKVNSSNVRW